MPEAKDVNVSWSELDEGVERPAGAVHELVTRRAPFLAYNLERLAFCADGGVMLPSAPDLAAAPAQPAAAAGGGQDSDDDADAGGASAGTAPKAAPQPEQPATGLLLLRQLFAGLDAVAGKKCLVAAHTDLLQGAPALALTQRRADNVALYLQGDREAWAASCMPYQDVEWQTILQWAAMRFGFPCDPGPIAEPLRAQARAALRRFRLRYNQDFGGDLPELGDISADDFGAFYDLYDAWLARVLGEDDLDAKRKPLKFLDPAAIGCGASFPNAPPRAPGFRAPANRRVELLFFDSDQPNLELKPPGVHVYALRELVPERLELEPVDCVVLEIAFSESIVEALPEGAALELTGPPGPPQRRLLADGQRDGGSMHYGFDWVDPSVAVTLKASAGGREVTLFEHQVKGQPDQKIELSGALELLLEDDVVGDDEQPDPLFSGRLPEFPGSPDTEADAGPTLELRLHDEHSRPLANAPFRVHGAAAPTAGRSGADGFIRLHLPQACPAKLTLEWSDGPADELRFSRELFVECSGSDPDSDKARLHNLGYDVEGDFETAVRAFQLDYQVDHEPEPAGAQGGALPAASRARLAAIFENPALDATPAGPA